MKKIQKHSGITLIALVITIIVLLILAGVTINLLAGEDGILKRVSDSVDRNTIAKVKEEVELKVAEILIDYYEDVYVDKNYSVNTVKGEYIEEKCPTGVTNSEYEFTIVKRKVTVFATENNGLSANLTGVLLDNGVIIWDETSEVPEEGISKVDINEPGKYELIFSAKDVVEWKPVEIHYAKYVENSAKCAVYSSNDLEVWNEVALETDGYNETDGMEEYKLPNGTNSKHLKVVLDLQSVSGENSEITYVKVGYYTLENVEIEPKITNTGADIVDGTYIVPIVANGETTASGSATVVQEIDVPEGAGTYRLGIEEIGNPETTIEITKSDGTTETVSGADINKIEIPAGSKLKITTTLSAGDGVEPVTLYKKVPQTTTLAPTEIKKDEEVENEEKWETQISKQYWYVKGTNGFWEKCFVDENEVGDTGIIEVSEKKRIQVLYKASDDGKNWGSTFSNLKEGESKEYLKIFVNYQTLGGEDYGHDGNYKIRVMLNDGYWTATFKDEDGTVLLEKRAYFTNSNKQVALTMPDVTQEKDEKKFAYWKIEKTNYAITESDYVMTENEEFIAVYIKKDIYKDYIQEGLILHLDEIKDNETWYDLSSSKKNATLYNCIVNNNNVQFKGSGDSYATLPEDAFGAYEASTIEVVAKDNIGDCILIADKADISKRGIFLRNKLIIPYATNNINASNVRGSIPIKPFENLNSYSVLYDGTADYDNNICYQDGVLLEKSDTRNAVSNTSTYPIIGRRIYHTGSTWSLKGKIYSIRVYNKMLNESEIEHNYEIDKARFGIN